MLKALQLSFSKNTIASCNRNLWQWIEDTFNSLDNNRIKEVGPNMACAEWLMKNGAQVRWKGCKEFVSHYDCLPHNNCASHYQFKIEQVYAGREASISHIGFLHFKDCNEISDVSFVSCNTIDDQALNELSILKDNLLHLEINSCINVTENGILELQYLQTLKSLKLKNIKLQNEFDIVDRLHYKMPNCNIQYINDMHD